MKLLLFALVLGTAAFGAPVEKLTDFELADQNSKTRIYRFPKSKVTVMAVADYKGSGELAPWIQRLYERYQKKIDIDGVADVSKIPKPLHAIFHAAFRKQRVSRLMSIRSVKAVVNTSIEVNQAVQNQAVDNRDRISEGIEMFVAAQPEFDV